VSLDECPEVLIRLVAHRFGSGVRHVAGQMRMPAPPGRRREVVGNRLDEAAVRTRDYHHQVHHRRAAALEPAQQARPGGCRFTVAKLQAENLAVARGIHTNGERALPGPLALVLMDVEPEGTHQHEGERLLRADSPSRP
jgi:hypothetical protein